VGVLTRQNINASLRSGIGCCGTAAQREIRATTDTNIWMRTDTNYNGLQMKLDRRFSNGFLLTTAYTFSKAINYTDDQGGLAIPAVLALNRGRAGYDRTHSFVQSYIYELPFGPNKRWLNSGVGRWVLGDWQLNGIFSAYSGPAVEYHNKRHQPQCAGQRQPSKRGERVQGSWGQLAREPSGLIRPSSRAPAANTYGTLGRNVFDGPGFANLDLSFFRKFRVTERVGGEFRAEFFNFTNTPQLNQPGVVVGNAGFGEITGAADMRRIQFGMKITF
jgi:hypothetical protein